MADGPYETWVKKLRVAIAGPTFKKIFGAFGYVLGDLALSWGRQANLEHLPEEAGDPDASLPLISSERLIRVGPGESNADFAHRLTKAIDQNRLRGAPLGLLIQLWYQGYENVVLVQQNGRYVQLDGAPDLDDLPNTPKIVGDLDPLTSDLSPTPPATKTIPSGTPWWYIDGNNDFCSRFGVLFVRPLPASWVDIVSPPTDVTAPPLEEVDLIRNLISEWKPAMSTCVGIYVQEADSDHPSRYALWGWPVTHTWGDGTVWGSGEVTFTP